MPEPSAETQSVHPSVVRRELRSGTFRPANSTLILRGHDPMDLSSAAVSYTLIPALFWTRTQKDALLQDLMTAWPQECSESWRTLPARSTDLPPIELPARKPLALSGVPYRGPGVPSSEFMRSLIEPISQLFFMNALVVDRFKWDDTLRQRHGFQGACQTTPDGTVSTISMDQNWADCYLNEPQRQAALFGTLLHECVHAWLQRYSCAVSYDHCRAVDCKTWIDQFGVTGHGSAFVELALHIQSVARVRIGADIDLGIERSIAFEERKRMAQQRNL